MKLKPAIEEFMKLYQTWIKSDHSEEEKIEVRLVQGDFSEVEKALKSLYVFLKGHKRLMDTFPSETECGSPKNVEDVMPNLEKEFKKHLGSKAGKFYSAMNYSAAWGHSCMARIKNSKFSKFYDSVNSLGVFFGKFVCDW